MSNQKYEIEQVPLDELKDQQHAILNKIAYADLMEEWKPGDSLYEAIDAIDPTLAKELKEAGLEHLVIKDYVNNNDESGFAAIAFEDPNTGQTGMSFRGTEGMDDLLNNPKDMADNTLTASIGVSPQSLEAIQFFEKNENKDGLNYLFGHSKGGELAAEVYVTNYTNIEEVHIINPQPINPEKLNVDQKLALKSDKFDAIVVNGDIVAWLGKTGYDVRYVKNNGTQEGFFGPHSVDAMYIDEDGNAVIEPKPFSGYLAQGITSWGAKTIIGGIQSVISIPTLVVNTVIRLGNFVINDLPDLARQFVTFMIQTIDTIRDFTTVVKAALKDFIGTIVASVTERFKLTFNSGYRYASNNPIIKVDTYRLRNYAQQLKSINRRLGYLDRRMDSLYFKVGLLDVWSLMQADLLTGESWRIKRNISYLEETARDFEEVERNITSNL